MVAVASSQSRRWRRLDATRVRMRRGRTPSATAPLGEALRAAPTRASRCCEGWSRPKPSRSSSEFCRLRRASWRGFSSSRCTSFLARCAPSSWPRWPPRSWAAGPPAARRSGFLAPGLRRAS